MNKRQYPPGIEEDKQEWLEAIENIYGAYGSSGVNHILETLSSWRSQNQIKANSVSVNTAYLNTIPLTEQPAYPGDLELE